MLTRTLIIPTETDNVNSLLKLDMLEFLRCLLINSVYHFAIRYGIIES